MARPANRTRSKQAGFTALSPAHQQHTITAQEEEKSPQSIVEKSSEAAGHAIASTINNKKHCREEISGVEAAPGLRRRTTRGGGSSSAPTASSSSGNGPLTIKQEGQKSYNSREGVQVEVPVVPIVKEERPGRAAAAFAKLTSRSSSTSIANTGDAGGGNNSAGGQSSATYDINAKKSTYKKSHYVSEAPKRLELVADRHSKGTLLNATIRIKNPDVRTKAFGWSHRGDNFFALALMSVKGERILPELYKDVPLRYRIAALASKLDSKGEEINTEEVLYDEAGQSTVGGLFYFRVPQFKTPGRYSISFRFSREAPSAFRKIDPVSQIVLVVPIDGSASSSSTSNSSNNNNENNVKNNNNDNNNNREKKSNTNQEEAGPQTFGLGDLTDSTEKARSLRSQERNLGGSSMAFSAALLGEGGGSRDCFSVDCAAGTGGNAGSKRQQSLEGRFASHVMQSPVFGLSLRDVEQRGRLVSLIIPAGLRLRLAEDWYAVTRKRYLTGNIPRGLTGCSGDADDGERGVKQRRELRQLPNVKEVIWGYEKTLPSSSPVSLSSSDAKGSNGPMGERLCTLFDGALGNLLLYRFEMNQYLALLEGLKESKRPPHQVWGAEHLLRLLAITPRLLASESRGGSKISTDDDKDLEGEFSKEDGESASIVEQAEEARFYIQGLLNHLAEHQDTLFAPYEEQPRAFGLDVAHSI
ncbi:hypothetical protein VYU27_000723 [Nannochloropsis oceanica]